MKVVFEIDMPKNCIDCKVSANIGNGLFYCPCLEKYFYGPKWEDKRQPNCPLQTVDDYLYKHGITNPGD